MRGWGGLRWFALNVTAALLPSPQYSGGALKYLALRDLLLF